MSGVPSTLMARLALAGVGMLPIGALPLAIAGLVPLSTSVLALVLPAWVGLGVLATRQPGMLRTLGIVIAAGMTATLCYDAARLMMTAAAGLTDGIPNIGRLLLSDMNAPTADVFGVAYTYRYLGDGGGLALAYAMGRRYGVGSGMAFGAAICVCLWATLFLVPVAQALLFPLTPVGMAITMTGHLVYGATLGALLQRGLQFRPLAGPTLTLTVTAGPLPPLRATSLDRESVSR